MSTNTNARGLRRGRSLGLAALALAGVTAGLAVATSGTASALPLCGGNQNIQMAPVTCTNSRTIDGTTFTVVLDVTAGGVHHGELHARRAALGGHAHPGALAPGDLVQPERPRGVGRDPGRGDVASLSTTLNCGQIDMKAVFTGNGDARRADRRSVRDDGQRLPVGAHHDGPADDGGDHDRRRRRPPTPPTGPTSTPSSVSPTSAAASTTAASSSGALPTTGTGTGLLVVSALLVLVGIVLITKSRGGDAVPQ